MYKMNKKYILSFVIVASLILVISGIGIVYALNSTIIFEANIINPAEEPEIIVDVSPSNIDFGDIGLGQKSNSTRVNITNWGKVAINVVPQLNDPLDDIFKNLYFQKRKTGNSSTQYIIGNFTLNIPAPTGNSGKADYCYVKLNLEGIGIDEIDENSIGHGEAEVTFIATAA